VSSWPNDPDEPGWVEFDDKNGPDNLDGFSQFDDLMGPSRANDPDGSS